MRHKPCPKCKEGKLHIIKGTEPYDEDHLMCDECNSTWPIYSRRDSPSNWTYIPSEGIFRWKETTWRVRSSDMDTFQELIDSQDRLVECHCSLQDVDEFLTKHGQGDRLNSLPLTELIELQYGSK